MKKLIGLVIILLSASIVVSAAATRSKKTYNASIPKAFIQMDASGNLEVANDLEVTGSISGDKGIVNVKQEFIAPAAASATGIKSAVDVTTTSIVGETTVTGFTIPAVSRDIVCVGLFDSGNSTATLSATLSIVGVNAQGESATETISFSTATGTGSAAFATITSLTIAASAYTVSENATKVTYKIGTGNKMGLVNAVSAVTDVYKIVENGSNVTVSASRINTDYNTYTPSSSADGSKNYEVHYKAISR